MTIMFIAAYIGLAFALAGLTAGEHGKFWLGILLMLPGGIYEAIY